MDGFELAAFYSLQHGLAGVPEGHHRVADGFKAVAGRGEEAGLEVRGQANAPGRAERDLFALDEAVIEVAVEGRGRHAERGGGLADVDEVAVGGRRFGLAGRDLPVLAEIADTIGVEAVAVGRAAALVVENAGDDGIGVMRVPAAAAAPACPRRCAPSPVASAARRRRDGSAHRPSSAARDAPPPCRDRPGG